MEIFWQIIENYFKKNIGRSLLSSDVNFINMGSATGKNLSEFISQISYFHSDVEDQVLS